MKKILVMLLVLTMLFSLSSCGKLLDSFGNLNPFGDNAKEEEPATPKNPTEPVPYDAETINLTLEQLHENGGFWIEMSMTTSGTGVSTEREYVTVARTQKRMYFKSSAMEYMVDYYAVDMTYVYIKNDDGEWERTGYSDLVLNRNVVEDRFNDQIAGLINSLRAHSIVAGQNLEKEEIYVAGRLCDKYTLNQSAYGLQYKVSYSIDQATGLCLKLDTDMGVGSLAGATVEFACTRFDVPCEIELPTEYVEMDDAE